MTPFDRWLTTELCADELVDEYDPPCPSCRKPCSDHEPVQRTDEDGNDYETMACPMNDALTHALLIKVDGRWLRADRARRTPWLYTAEDAAAEAARLTAEYPGREYKVVAV